MGEIQVLREMLKGAQLQLRSKEKETTWLKQKLVLVKGMVMDGEEGSYESFIQNGLDS